MNLMNSLKMLIGILLGLSLTRCATAPPNVEVCGKLQSGAFCTFTIDGPDRRMSDEEWARTGRISMSAEAFGEIKKFILTICERTGRCTSDEEDTIATFGDEYDD